jgi:hypothetical protein
MLLQRQGIGGQSPRHAQAHSSLWPAIEVENQTGKEAKMHRGCSYRVLTTAPGLYFRSTKMCFAVEICDFCGDLMGFQIVQPTVWKAQCISMSGLGPSTESMYILTAPGCFS